MNWKPIGTDRKRISNQILFISRSKASSGSVTVGNASTSSAWTEHCNDLIYRITQLYPDNFVGVAQLPQTPGVAPDGRRERIKVEYPGGALEVQLDLDDTGHVVSAGVVRTARLLFSGEVMV